MHVGAVQAGQRVLLMDDLVATGGTMGAGIQLMNKVTSCDNKSCCGAAVQGAASWVMGRTASRRSYEIGQRVLLMVDLVATVGPWAPA